ncbi:hypothetical protein [Psychrobacter sp. UBA3962]|uniref:hypothetical protein n=1 Tax=Psychrobacter sp. UBA3962 TaxID=1947352 RepID=UPI0025F84028|nr:hypothetical protein [Psychrobacter sp. UBA3962]
MKVIFNVIAVVLTACSFSGFKPATSPYYWHLPGNDLTLDEYIDKKHKEMEESP